MQMGKGEIKLYLFTDDMTSYAENRKELTKKTLGTSKPL